MALRLSTKQVLSRCVRNGVGNPRNTGLAQSLFRADGRLSATLLSPYRGQISWMGTLSDKTATISDKSLQNLGTSRIHMDLSPLLQHRMLSTSSVPNGASSKKEQDSEDSLEKKPEPTSFRTMMRRYGKIFIATYFTVYVSTVTSLFLAVQSGHLDAMYMISLLTGTSSPSEPGGVADPETIKDAASAMKDLVELLESYTLTRPVAPMVEEYPWTANFAIAWVATKFTEPIRFGATVVLTPPIARFLGYRPTPSAKGPIDVVAPKEPEDSSSSTR